MSAPLCRVCGAACPIKDPHAPGPQPKYCGRRCQTKAAHRANVERRQANALAARRVELLTAYVERLVGDRAAYLTDDELLRLSRDELVAMGVRA